MWQYDPSVGDMVWVEPAGASANVPANIASLVPSGGTVQQNMAAQLQGYGAEGGEMSFNPDGTFTISTPLADNQFLNTIVDSSGKQISQNVSSGKDTGLQDLAAFAAIPLTAGGAGGVLGGALTGGALSGTAASALGNALISGTAGAISGQDPLKAALLAAGGTYAGSLFGGPSAATMTDAQSVAADAAQLAAQGLGADQIEQVLRASGVNTSVAAVAADAASSGLSVNKIVEDIASGNRSLFTGTATSVSPATVTTDPLTGLQTATATGSLASPVVNAGGLLAAIPSAVLPQANIVSTPLAPLDQQITVTGTKATPTLEDTLASVAPLATITAPSVTTADQVIDVTGTKASTTPPEDLGAVIATPVITPPGQVTVTPPTDITKKSTDPDAPLLGTLTLADILKALASVSSLGMLGGDGTGTGTTTSLTPTTPVPVGNADYYNAVQQYYNTYMPQTPRDVATPLQQWYEGKFGG